MSPEPLFSIERFKSAVGTPARSHLFRCTVIPENTGVSPYFSATPYLCKAVTLPSATVETTELFYFSRAVKIPSRRTYAPLTLTFFHSEDYKIRAGFELWSGVLNAYEENQRGTALLYGRIILDHYSSVASTIAFNRDTLTSTLTDAPLQHIHSTMSFLRQSMGCSLVMMEIRKFKRLMWNSSIKISR